jgi:hypothetical protein
VSERVAAFEKAGVDLRCRALDSRIDMTPNELVPESGRSCQREGLRSHVPAFSPVTFRLPAGLISAAMAHPNNNTVRCDAAVRKEEYLHDNLS